MGYRISCGPSVGRVSVVTDTAAQALDVVREFQEHGKENIVISRMAGGELELAELEALAADGEAGELQAP
jgi:hypothetical protein